VTLTGYRAYCGWDTTPAVLALPRTVVVGYGLSPFTYTPRLPPDSATTTADTVGPLTFRHSRPAVSFPFRADFYYNTYRALYLVTDYDSFYTYGALLQRPHTTAHAVGQHAR